MKRRGPPRLAGLRALAYHALGAHTLYGDAGAELPQVYIAPDW